MLTLGADPDLHRTSIAWVETVDGRHRLAAAWIVRSNAKARGPEAVQEIIDRLREVIPPSESLVSATVELPEVYPGSPQRPNDLLHLATVAGGIAAWCGGRLVRPRVWKGSVPKPIHHARIMRDMGWSETPVMPGVKPGDWKHLMDAVGLALWGARNRF